MSDQPPRRVPFDPAAARRSVLRFDRRAPGSLAASRVALVDGDDRALDYDEIVRASFALGSALKSGTRAGECVGVMLPTGAAATLTFFVCRLQGAFPP